METLPALNSQVFATTRRLHHNATPRALVRRHRRARLSNDEERET